MSEDKDYHKLGQKDAEAGGDSNPPHEKGMLEEALSSYSDKELSDREDYRHGYASKK